MVKKARKIAPIVIVIELLAIIIMVCFLNNEIVSKAVIISLAISAIFCAIIIMKC